MRNIKHQQLSSPLELSTANVSPEENIFVIKTQHDPSNLLCYAHSALIGAGCLLGLWNVLARSLMTSGASPIFFSLLRHSLAAIGFLGILRISSTEEFQFPKNEWKRFLLYGFGIYMIQISFIYGVKFTDAQTVGIFQCIGPSMTLALAVFFQYEKFQWTKLCSILVGFIGTILISILNGKKGGINTILGCMFLFNEAVAVSLITLYQKNLFVKYSPLETLAFTYPFAVLFWTLTFLISLIFEQDCALTGLEVLGLLYSILFTSISAYFLKTFGNTILDASIVMLYQGVQPVVTFILAIMFLSEKMEWYEIVGATLIILSLLLASKSQKDRDYLKWENDPDLQPTQVF